MVVKGSYTIGSFADPQGEMDRLKSQANAVMALESSVLRESGLSERDRVLELGCGPGFVSDLLASIASQGSLVAVDNNSKLLGLVRSNITHPPAGGVYPVLARGDRLPLQERSVDFAYARFLLQHVPAPEAVIEEALRILAPGGRLCVIDSDDGLVVNYPQDQRLMDVLDAALAAQTESGGDRLIGRKLYSMLHHAGFERVQAKILSLTSSQIPFEVLFNILFGFKASLAGKAAEMRALYDELKPRAEGGEFLLAGGVFIVTGIKG